MMPHNETVLHLTRLLEDARQQVRERDQIIRNLNRLAFGAQWAAVIFAVGWFGAIYMCWGCSK